MIADRSQVVSGVTLSRTYKGNRYTCRVLDASVDKKEVRCQVDGIDREFSSLSQAASAVRSLGMSGKHANANGWVFWDLVGDAPEATDAQDTDSIDDPLFALEEHLEEFMEANWDRIDFGSRLEIFTDKQGNAGRQYPTGIGRIDFLCEDKAADELVVLELKRGRSSDVALGQVQRYMGWVKENLSNGRAVRGIVIAHEDDDRLRYALLVARDVEAWTYRVSFELVRAGPS